MLIPDMTNNCIQYLTILLRSEIYLPHREPVVPWLGPPCALGLCAPARPFEAPLQGSEAESIPGDWNHCRMGLWRRFRLLEGKDGRMAR
jgi:hypothetical protein